MGFFSRQIIHGSPKPSSSCRSLEFPVTSPPNQPALSPGILKFREEREIRAVKRDGSTLSASVRGNSRFARGEIRADGAAPAFQPEPVPWDPHSPRGVGPCPRTWRLGKRKPLQGSSEQEPSSGLASRLTRPGNAERHRKEFVGRGEICGSGLVFLHRAGEVLVAEPLIICGVA